jgi:uncharacterized lipoprotein YmbA
MRPRPAAILGFLGLALLAASCVSLKRTPEARFFVLRSLAEPAAEATPPTSVVVGLLPVVLPDYLDRAQLVSWAAEGEIKIDEFLRWAEPLDAGVSRTLTENLSALVPEARVIRAPWSSRARLRCRVRVVLEKFGPQANGEVRLDGRFVLLGDKGEGALGRRDFHLQRDLPAARASDPGTAVGLMSQLLADLAGQIATAIRELPAPPAPKPAP